MELVLPLAIGMTAESHAHTEESDLVAASLRGDHAAFAELVRRHQSRVFRLAGRFFQRREDVEDVAQDTFVTAWRRLGTYAARAPFEHWITRVCLRLCYARLGAERRREAPLGEQNTVAPPRDMTAAIDLERLLATLAPADRFVLLLLDGEGWSVNEIAARIGWTATNVKVRAFRARRRLRRVLEDSVMAGSGKRESVDRRVEEIRRLLRERRALVDPDPHFVDRVMARLPRGEDRMLAWAARRVLPVTLALAAVLTIAVLVTHGSASRQAEAASISSSLERGSDPLEWLLENRQEAR